MASKNQKIKHGGKGVATQAKRQDVGQKTIHFTNKFEFRKADSSYSFQIARNKAPSFEGYKRRLNIKPLSPVYPDSMFQSKESYDAMVKAAIEDAKAGKAIMRDKPMSQDVN